MLTHTTDLCVLREPSAATLEPGAPSPCRVILCTGQAAQRHTSLGLFPDLPAAATFAFEERLRRFGSGDPIYTIHFPDTCPCDRAGRPHLEFAQRGHAQKPVNSDLASVRVDP